MRRQDYSRPVEKIMGHPPHWVLRWGNVVLGGLILCFGIFASTVRFERKMHAKVSLRAEGSNRFSGEVLLPVTLREKVASNEPVVIDLPGRKVRAEIARVSETPGEHFVALEIELTESSPVPPTAVDVVVPLGSRTLVDYLKKKAAHD